MRIAENSLLCIACGGGIIMTALRMPGTWFIALAALVHQWMNNWPEGTRWILYVLACIALIAEAIEFASTGLAAKRAGASRQAAWGALIGGFAGMFLLTLPLWIIGSMIGAVLGSFLGAALTEIWVRRRLAHGARVGLFAALGMVVGTAMKVAAAILMSSILLTSAILQRTN